jgi:hypothetical protein
MTVVVKVRDLLQQESRLYELCCSCLLHHMIQSSATILSRIYFIMLRVSVRPYHYPASERFCFVQCFKMVLRKEFCVCSDGCEIHMSVDLVEVESVKVKFTGEFIDPGTSASFCTHDVC